MRTLVTVVLMLALAPHAVSLTISRPQTNALAVAVNAPEEAVPSNSGHFATTDAGSECNISWSSNPSGSVTYSSTTGAQVKFMTVPNANYDAVMLVAACTSDGHDGSASVTVRPVKLSWMDASTYDADDRLVHVALGESPARSRELRFKVYGKNVTIPDLRIRAHKLTGSIGGIPVQGTGQVQMTGCTDGSGNPMTFSVVTANVEWKIQNLAATVAGNEYVLTVVGATTSLFMDDIELDLRLPQSGNGSSEGIGAALKYTVVRVNLIVDGLGESAEESPGRGAYLTANRPGHSTTNGARWSTW